MNNALRLTEIYEATVSNEVYVASVADENYEASIDSSFNESYNATAIIDVQSAEQASDIYIATIKGEGEKYMGRYRVTPTRYEQVLNTSGYNMVDDVIIEAIPKNYGLVERVGMSLRVS